MNLVSRSPSSPRSCSPLAAEERVPAGREGRPLVSWSRCLVEGSCRPPTRTRLLQAWSIGIILAAVLIAAQSPPVGPAASHAAGIQSGIRLPPIPESPGDYLRRLLGMNAAGREQALAREPEALRNYWRAKLQEYDALAPSARDTRLRAVQFRWELLSLMKLAPAARLTRLNTLSAGDRAFLRQRLEQWDALPAPLQREFLENETTVLYFLRLQSGTPADQERLLRTFPPDHRQKLEANLSRWRTLGRGQREKMLERFNQFFEITGDERERILGILPETERRQAKQVLQTIGQLPKEQRQQVLDAFRRFADMTPAEREQFLQNAARWEAMSPREREAWLSLMNRLPPVPPGVEPLPPLPPDFGTPPPLPPGVRPRATN